MYYVISGHHQVYHGLPDHGLCFYMTRNPHTYNNIANSNDTVVNFNNFRMNGLPSATTLYCQNTSLRI